MEEPEDAATGREKEEESNDADAMVGAEATVCSGRAWQSLLA